MKKKNQNRRKKPIKNKKSKRFSRNVSSKLKLLKNVLNERGLELFDTEIVYGVMREKAYEDLPDSVKQQAEDLYDLIFNDDTEKTVPPLLTLIEEYPHIPQFKNFLSAAYSQMGNKEKADEVTMKICEQHPDYLFGKINYASMCLGNGEFEKVPEIFDNKMALELLYPQRKSFHVTEYTGFSSIMALYYLELGEIEIAGRYYKILKELDPDSPSVERIGNQFMLKYFNPENVEEVLKELESEMSEEELKELEMCDEEWEKLESERFNRIKD